MKIYQVGGKNAIIHENHLFIEAEVINVESTSSLTLGQPVIIPKEKLLKKHKVSKQGRGKRLGEIAKETLMEEIAAGNKSVPDLADEYQISQSYIYNLKKKLIFKPKDDSMPRPVGARVLNFSCECGYGFSAAPKNGKVNCPDCKKPISSSEGVEI